MLLGTEYLIGSVAVAGVLAVIAKAFVFNDPNKPSTGTTGGAASSSGRRGHKRSLSYSSSAMLSGAFPEKSQVREPIINVLFYFKKVPSVERLKEICDELFFFDRFRSVVTHNRSTGEYSFEDVSVDSLDFANDIIKTVTLAKGEDMMARVDQICNTELDCRERVPLWRMIRIVNSNNSGENEGLVIRIHHSIGDGLSLIGCIGKVFTDKNGKV
jgi:hypothetical protein